MRPVIGLLFVVIAPWGVSAADPVIGDRVFIKDGAEATIGETKVDPDKILFPETVEAVDGELLWLVRGWVRKSNVMTTDEAFAFYDKQTRDEPTNAKAWRLRGLVWLEKGDRLKAREDFSEAIELNRNDPLNYADRGISYFGTREYDEAITDFDHALRLDPTLVMAYLHRASTWIAKGEYDKAIADCNEAIRLDPKDAYSYPVRAYALYSKKDDKSALADYETALRLYPNLSYSCSSLAWFLAVCPDGKYRDGKRAIALALKACELTGWKDAYNIGVLASAYAEAGQWENAIKRQQRYIEMVSAEAEKQWGRKLLELYQLHQPYHEGMQLQNLQKPVLIGEFIHRNLDQIVFGMLLVGLFYIGVLVIWPSMRDRWITKKENSVDAPADSRALDMVTVARFRTLTEAEACKMRLESEDVMVFLADAETVRTDWFLSDAIGSIKVQVPSDQVETAATLLKQIRRQQVEQQKTANEDLCLACGAVMSESALQCQACGWTYEQGDVAET